MLKEFFDQFPYILLGLEGLYLIGIIFLAGKIIMDTRNTSKTLAYLMLIIFLPVLGIIIYFVFGVNYRKNKFYTFKIERNEQVYQAVSTYIRETHHKTLESHQEQMDQFLTTVNFLYNAGHSPLSQGNYAEILVNGEGKFEKVFEVLEKAIHHIHLEYYIYDNDSIGNRLADLLIKKAGQGVKVRFLYDDMGSGKIGKKLLQRLKDASIEVSPVNKITFRLLANRVNYRDHRKIIIVDGAEAFTGGINVSDKYINPNPKQYWRDVHLYMKGEAAFYFQFLFFSNWIFATEKIPEISQLYFTKSLEDGSSLIQTAASGPDTQPSIMLSTTSAILSAKKRIYIVTPYFIPVETVFNAIKQAAISGVDVRLMVPKSGDSIVVNAAAYSYYEELLENKVRVFFYKKGFIHAKTMLIDDIFSSVGTANMDVRSQELNFEVNALVFDQKINGKLQDLFREDMNDCEEIHLDSWKKRPKYKVFFEHLARLLSPLI
ncbi:cardiolipin synthase [Chryseobacterium carnipullorum]|uniref:Cardiolipin synthase n=1 Tax=Chryseobacterium carnipullorum TaxID=1124835 RepID=A0A376DVR5_CHRCU|nr:cardiolipin synthase [Chryseobacterium carnipullorum]AZA49872.1 cardiolipin synthase [Chryseobacterium carnipullorum]AZA64761.1 cardiolipin synthase [Chryseobacterium carnipullorum]STC96073.1 Cardiolipin synthase [Chryseobacterium carnipullorum]